MSLRPSKSSWIAAATAFAQAMEIEPRFVMGGQRTRRASLARWQAWHAMLSSRPYSIAGLAAVSGFDHTSILYGLKRLQGLSPSEVHEVGISRCINEKPLDALPQIADQ